VGYHAGVSVIAFFDFDGTLLRGDSGRICALPALRAGLVPPASAARLVATYLLYGVGLRSRRDVQLAGFACTAGRGLDELSAIIERLHERHLRPMVSAPMRSRVAEHRARGEHTCIVTASGHFWAEPLARELGIDDVLGTRVRLVGGRSTGEVDGEVLEGQAKVAAARRVADARGAALTDCWFYSDHTADLPLLDAVGRPVVVGPTRALAAVARARRWPIVSHQQ
jgi:putative phosphoserine phosphatase/1-acylglycerol-3-phosphate O-acyltransferase